MENLRRYQADPDLLKSVSRKYLSGVFNVGATTLPAVIISLLTTASSRLDAVFPWDTHASAVPYVGSLNELLSQAEQAYDSEAFGAWSLAGFRALTGLGAVVAEPSQTHFAARLHFKSQIKVAAMMPMMGTLDSLVALYAKFMIKNSAGGGIRKVLSSEEQEFEQKREFANSGETMDAWLARVTDLLPVLDSPLLIYRCLRELVSQKHIKEEELARDVLPLQICLENEKRLEELLAHLFSPGLEYAKDGKHYVQRILDLASKDGGRAAKRQTRYDLQRLTIPRFLAEAACAEIDRLHPTA